jgi:hypothetical protein
VTVATRLDSDSIGVQRPGKLGGLLIRHLLVQGLNCGIVFSFVPFPSCQPPTP